MSAKTNAMNFNADIELLQQQRRLFAPNQPPTELWFMRNDADLDPLVERVFHKAQPLVLRHPADRVAAHTDASADLLDYAIDKLGVRRIVLCEHSNSSGVPSSDPLEDRLNRQSDLPPRNRSEATLKRLVRGVQQRQARAEAARTQLAQQVRMLLHHPVVSSAARNGLRVEALFYMCETGLLSRYDEASDRFNLVSGPNFTC